ncbi:nitrate ABC transporter permease [Opitutaceae bacterium EW11]|nr:nitrate ABC transporter permease [Opitutaceae bacterium EW11]
MLSRTKRDPWFAILRPLSGRRGTLLYVVSFLLPLAAWSAVSYLPFLWHPMVCVTEPGGVSWFKPGLLVERTAFEKENARALEAGKTAASGRRANPVFLPAPHEVARALYTAFTTKPVLRGDVWLHESLWRSVQTIFWGFLLSSVVGIPLGILCGSYAVWSRVSEPVIDFIRYMPAPAFGALAVAVLGISDAPKIAIIFIGTFFQQVLVVANTIRRVDPSLLEAAQTLGARGRRLVTKVIVPAKISELYTDTRILLGWAWTYLIVAEVVGVSSGITYFINQQAKYRNFDNVYAAIVIIGLLGLGTDQFLAFVGRRLFPWENPRPSRLRTFFVRLFAGREVLLFPGSSEEEAKA